MKITVITFALLACFFAFSFTPKESEVSASKKPLKLIFKNLPYPSANIRIGIFRRQDNFPDINSVFRFYGLKPDGKTEASMEISDLEYGEYVVGCFQDLNGNNALETTPEGFPTEPVGLSNNFLITSYAPSFEDCKVDYSKKNRMIVFERYTGGK
jgi:uncharacterized protein (DUF2141 family)